MLTEQEINLICTAAADLESGNHLLRPRSAEEYGMLEEVCGVLKKIEFNEKLTDREYEIYTTYRRCTEIEANI